MSEEIKETSTGELEQGEFKLKKKPKKLANKKSVANVPPIIVNDRYISNCNQRLIFLMTFLPANVILLKMVVSYQSLCLKQWHPSLVLA